MFNFLKRLGKSALGDHTEILSFNTVTENQQPAEKPDYDPRGSVEVHSVHWTIQGEGPHVGRPAIFVRLAGCNLQCPRCDTDYTSTRARMNPPQVVRMCQDMKTPKRTLVVLTGGEPFRQDISAFCNLLLNTGFEVQVETNGTLPQVGVSNKVMVVCSPKTPAINQTLKIDAYKYVLDAEHVDPDDGLPTSVLGMAVSPARPRPMDRESRVPIYLQPMDSGNEEQNLKNLEAVVQSCMAFNYRLCLQVQKIIGLP